MYMYVYIYMYIYIYISIYICTRTHKHIHTHTHTHNCIYTYIYIHVYIFKYIYIHSFIHMQYYIYMRIFMYIQLNRGFGRWRSRATGICNDAGHRCPGCWQPGRPSQYNPLNQPSQSRELNGLSPFHEHKKSRFHGLNQSCIHLCARRLQRELTQSFH